ncbi:ABC transporter permease [Vallitalea okinawensis]|uniref:ABC transporter permease n=1 Tax=Vallitalea okinawensis TaxID=2078660 RepID=UPI000CFBD80F|nr:ABC transporter permease [Vallitalea okinawensis]
MQRKIKKLLWHNEFYIFLVILLISLVVQLRSGQFYTSNNIVDLISAMIVPGLFAIGAFMVLVSGGIDVSFPALASLSVYATTRILVDINFQGGIWLPILLCMIFGGFLGAINGLLISKFKLQPLIVTLGVASIFKGFMQGVLKSVQISVIPKGMSSFGTASLFVVKNQESGLAARMPVAVLVLIIVLILTYFILNHTMYGRGIYAIGGNETSAERAGFNVKRIKFTLYILVGIISSLAGLIRVSMMTQMHPTNMLGMEMMIIAGVVLGGVAITGGAGTLIGCMLGTILIVLVQNSLILLGVPTFWQGFFLGMLIILGTGVSAYRVRQANKPQKFKVPRGAANEVEL